MNVVIDKLNRCSGTFSLTSSSRRRGSVQFSSALVLTFLLAACTNYDDVFEDNFGYGQSSKGVEFGGSTLKDLRDNHTYEVAKVGSLYWMMQDLSYEYYSTGKDYYLITACPKMNVNDEPDCDETGFLYPGQRLEHACPEGWRLPDIYEWQEFYNSSTFKAASRSTYKGYISGDKSQNKYGEAAYYWANTSFSNGGYKDCISFTSDDDSFDYIMQCHEQWKLAVRCVVEVNKYPESSPVEDSFEDSRDGRVYRTVTIGDRVWMAENAQYETGNSFCYDDEPGNCETYGRMYMWEDAYKGACPRGWHLPTQDEFDMLIENAGGSTMAAVSLKSEKGWASYSGTKGTDDYGFSALPAGEKRYGENFTEMGTAAYFWSATKGDKSFGDGYAIALSIGYSTAMTTMESTTLAFSVRCVKDN